MITEMTLRILVPQTVLLEEEVRKVVAQGDHGSFGMLPRHVDFVAVLTPGILSYETDGGESFVAVDRGILVKQGPEVLVSVREAVADGGLGELETTVRDRFARQDEEEKQMETVLARLEADFVRRYAGLRESTG